MSAILLPLLAISLGIFLPIGLSAEDSGQLASSEPRIDIKLNVAPSLCAEIAAQIKAAITGGDNACALPHDSDDGRLQRPKWKKIDPASVDDILLRHVPLFGWDTRKLLSAIGEEVPSLSHDQRLAEFWRRYGGNLSAALNTAPSSLEAAQFDADNDGLPDRVYRITTMQPFQDKQSIGWRPLACLKTSSSENEHYYHSFFLDDSDGGRERGVLDSVLYTENTDIFTYNGKAYVILIGGASVNISQPESSGSPSSKNVAATQKCEIEFSR